MRKTKYGVRLEFEKKRELIYISHLDLIRLFMRTLRRARLPVAYSQGFNPHPQLSIDRALAVGVVGKCEKMRLFLTQEYCLREMKKRLNALLPKGIRIKKVYEL